MLDRRSARALLPVAAFFTATGGAHAEPITLQDALARARRGNPELQAALADVAIAEGERAAAGQLTHNPEVSVAGGPAFVAGSTFADVEVTLAQTFELGGARGRRRDAGSARLLAARARLHAKQWAVEVAVHHAHALAIVERRRVERAVEAEAVAGELRAAAHERLRLGAGTQLEINVAISDQGRVRHDRIDAERRLESARAALAAAVGAAAGQTLEPSGELPRFAPLTDSEEGFVARALAQRAELAAGQAELRAAGADVRTADARAVPDVTVAVTYDREDEPDGARQRLLAGVTVPIPVLTRNQGERRAARARLRRARIVADAGRVDVERQARTAYRNYARAREAVLGFDEAVIRSLGDNLTLARQSFTAGKIGYLELNVLRRDLIATGFAHLDALAEGVDAWRDAALAAGGALQVSP